jgi:hypothetical protein
MNVPQKPTRHADMRNTTNVYGPEHARKQTPNGLCKVVCLVYGEQFLIHDLMLRLAGCRGKIEPWRQHCG